MDRNVYWGCLYSDSNYFIFSKLIFILLYKGMETPREVLTYDRGVTKFY